MVALPMPGCGVAVTRWLSTLDHSPQASTSTLPLKWTTIVPCVQGLPARPVAPELGSFVVVAVRGRRRRRRCACCPGSVQADRP